MSAEAAVLALDLGTTSVRALVLNRAGTVLGRASAPLSHRYPQPGWLEQDPDEFVRLSIDVMRTAIDLSGQSPESICSLGIVSQRSTAIAWDAETGEALAPAIGWQDRRNQERVDQLIALGIPINTLASATKFEWLLLNDSRVQAAAARGTLRFGTPDVWLTHRLSGGGCFVTDPGHAACTGMYNAEEEGWWSVALQLFGIDAAFLPEIVPTSHVVGEVQASLLGASIPIAARAGDQQASTFAQGVNRPGMAKLTLGTSAMLNLHVEDAKVLPPEGYYALPLWRLGEKADTETKACLEGTVITAGSSIEWLSEIGLLPAATELDSMASNVPDSQGVVFVPAFQGLGSPYLDVSARASIFGLTRGSEPAHIARAAIDGVSHRCVDLCESLPLEDEPLRVDGGLARSTVLMQTLSDLAGRPLLRAAESETTALGAAYFAGLAVGYWNDPAEAIATAQAPTPFHPKLSDEQRRSARTRWRDAISRTRSEQQAH